MAKDTLVHTPPERDKSRLFFVTKVMAATGVSRSTILRMEERGLLKPAYTAPSGLRYYDNYNVSRVMEIQRLISMGFSNEEARLYFSSGGDAGEMYAIVQEKLRRLQWTFEDVELRAMDEPCQSVELVQLVGSDYYVERGLCETAQEKNDLAYNAYHNCVDKGYALAPGPLVLVHEWEGFLENGYPDGPYQVASCTPLLPDQVGKEIETFPGGRALMMLFCGTAAQLNEAYVRMGREARERGLVPAGYVRTVWVVGPYTGRELKPSRYRARIILPVEEPAEDRAAL